MSTITQMEQSAERVRREIEMFDYTVADLDSFIEESKEKKRSKSMFMMSMISDIQEMLAMGMDEETIRRALNRVKYFIDKWEETN